MIIAVDFDGCLASAGSWPGVGEPNLVLIEWLKAARNNGDKVILWTCRMNEALDKAVQMCREYGLEFDEINDNIRENVEKFGNNCRKVFADLYIDDKACQVVYPEPTSYEWVPFRRTPAPSPYKWERPEIVELNQEGEKEDGR